MFAIYKYIGLREEGLEVSIGVGHSTFEIDLVMGRPGGDGTQLVAVMLDGPGWDLRGSASDRDLLPIDVLSTMGWKRIERVWMPEWCADSAAVVARLVRVAEEAGARAAGEPTDGAGAAAAGRSGQDGGAGDGLAPAEGDDGAGGSRGPQDLQSTQELGPVVGADSPQGAAEVPSGLELLRDLGLLGGPVEYVSWQPDGQIPVEVLDSAGGDERARAQVVGVVRAVCDVEAPMTRDRLRGAVLRAFGVDRASHGREEAVEALLDEGVVHTDECGFVWRHEDAARLPVSFRRNALDHVGSIEEIHPRELMALMAQVRASEPERSSSEDLCVAALRRLSDEDLKLSARGVLAALTEALRRVEDSEAAPGEEAAQA